MGKINVIGMGYIGLPTALMLAAHGNEVVGTDFNGKLVEQLNKGVLTFKENGLEELFKSATNNGIEFSKDYYKTDKYIIAVPTPYDSLSKKIDASYVIAATKTVLDVCEEGSILVIESTISPGTIDKFIRPVVSDKGYEIGKDIHLVHAPERIIPGRMIYELINNSRTIGADEIKIGEEVKNWYKTFCRGEIVITNIKTAEMSKVVENTFRDINIAFANELAKMCNEESMDVYELINIANMHPRVNILQPGPGVGGHCISVDPWFLVGDYPKISNVVLASREENNSMPKYVFERINRIMEENEIKDYSRIGLYGLTYKEDVDDTRESPTLQLMEIFNKEQKLGFKVYDPMINEQKVPAQVMDFNEFLNSVDIVVVLVGHSEIRENQKVLKEKIVYDTRNIIHIGKKVYKL